ncbi:MAG: DEAD/DEAH box helicase [Dehalococcoidia bacterium]|nr:DEAD/DEAH box helicase [Dehalococcoidia bacterium]
MDTIRLLHHNVASAFYGNFRNLHPAQQDAIEPLLSGDNLVLSAGTASGKTEAVTAPLVNRYYYSAYEQGTLAILYIAPTKALVNDIARRLYLPCHNIGWRIGIRHGDRDDLISKDKPNLLITTPESFEVLLFRKDPALQDVCAVVIDEVHLLYNTQRGLQLSVLLKRLEAMRQREIQKAALSATINSPVDIRDFLFGPGAPCIFLQYPCNRPIESHIRVVRSPSELVEVIALLLDGKPRKLLAFADSRRECERLVDVLKSVPQLANVVLPHYSSLSAEVRLEHEKQFASIGTAVCVATSTLELGIDIGDIDAVILWGVPPGIESFLQRIGRGNRRSNRTNVICLVPDDTEDYVVDTLGFLTMIDMAGTGTLSACRPYELYGAIAQQCLSMIASDDASYVRLADLLSFFGHKNLERNVLESVLAELETSGYIKRHGYKNRYGADGKLHELIKYRMIYGNYGIASQETEVRYMSKVLGHVPRINLLRLAPGSLVRFKGERWRVKKRSRDAFELEHSKTQGKYLDFTYGGNRRDALSYLANRIWHFIHGNDLSLLSALHGELQNDIKRVIGQFRQNGGIDCLPYLEHGGKIRYFTFAGRIINDAIALITDQSKYTADNFSLTVRAPIRWNSIPADPKDYAGIFHLIFQTRSDQSIFQAMLPESLQLDEYIQEWLKSEETAEVLKRLSEASLIQIQADPFVLQASITK